MKERLKKIRAALGLSQQEIADKLGYELTTYRSFEYKTKNLPAEFLNSLINNFGININWLLTGQGGMFINAPDCSINTAEIGNRLSEIQNKTNYKDKDMAELLGIYEYEYRGLKQGMKEPSLKIISILKKSFNISIDWFLYGE